MGNWVFEKVLADGDLQKWLIGEGVIFESPDRDFPWWPTNYGFIARSIILDGLAKCNFLASVKVDVFKAFDDVSGSPIGIRAVLMTLAAIANSFCHVNVKNVFWRERYNFNGDIIQFLPKVIERAVFNKEGLCTLNVSQGDASDWPPVSAWSDVLSAMGTLQRCMGDNLLELYDGFGFGFDDIKRHVTWTDTKCQTSGDSEQKQ